MNKIIQLNIGCGEMILSDYIIRKEARRYIGIENINLGMEATKI